jgi:hypothetical protein
MTSGRESLGRHAAHPMVDIEFAGRLEALVFRFHDGRILGLPLQLLDGLDPSPVTRVSLIRGGNVALIEQFSGNRLEVSHEEVRHLVDPIPGGWYRSTG